MKLKNFYILLSLICFWTCFFGLFKYFFWAQNSSSLSLTLEEIAGYLAFWSFFAYFFWSIVFEILKEKYTLICISLSITLLLLVTLIVWVHSKIFIASLSIGAWFFYGLWNVIKNIIISQEIERTGKTDTLINGFSNIAFFVSIILGSIGGGLLFENFGNLGIVGIIAISVVAGGVWMNIYQEKACSIVESAATVKNFKSSYLPNFVFVIKKNFFIMFLASIYLVIATILSQKSIAYSVDFLWKTNSEASTLLLYSAVGTIIWNFSTMRIQRRWLWTTILWTLFAWLIFAFSYLMANFLVTAILATLAGFFFWTNYNLVESYFLLKIGEQWKRDFGASSYGIISSICISWGMFLTHFLEGPLWLHGIFIFWGCVIAMLTVVLYVFQEKV